nr:vegetative cell wall protein gp1-like [Aegilops tauschii subsp. strangulata]
MGAYLAEGTLPEKEEDTERVARQATTYCIEDDQNHPSPLPPHARTNFSAAGSVRRLRPTNPRPPRGTRRLPPPPARLAHGEPRPGPDRAELPHAAPRGAASAAPAMLRPAASSRRPLDPPPTPVPAAAVGRGPAPPRSRRPRPSPARPFSAARASPRSPGGVGPPRLCRSPPAPPRPSPPVLLAEAATSSPDLGSGTRSTTP